MTSWTICFIFSFSDRCQKTSHFIEDLSTMSPRPVILSNETGTSPRGSKKELELHFAEKLLPRYYSIGLALYYGSVKSTDNYNFIRYYFL